MGGDDAALLGHQGGEGADDVGAARAGGGWRRSTPTKSRTGLPKPSCSSTARAARRGGLHVDQGRFEQAAEIGAGVDQAAERVHLGYDGIERVVVLGVGVERGGVAVGKAAAGGNRLCRQRPRGVPIRWAARERGRDGEPAALTGGRASSMGSCGGQHGEGLISGRNVMLGG